MSEKIKKQEPVFEQLMTSGNNLLENTDSGPEKDELQNKLDDMKQRWDDIKEQVATHKDKVNAAVPEASKYSDAANELEPWLSNAEEKLASLDPISTDEKAVKERQELVNAIKEDIEKHRPERDTVDEKSSSVVDLTEADQDAVESQAKDLIERFDKLSADCLDKEKEVNEVQDALAAYSDALSPVQEVLAKAEDLIGDATPVSGDLEKNKEELENIKVRVFFAFFSYYIKIIVH